MNWYRVWFWISVSFAFLIVLRHLGMPREGWMWPVILLFNVAGYVQGRTAPR